MNHYSKMDRWAFGPMDNSLWNVKLLRTFTITFLAGVNRFVTIAEGRICEATSAFLRGGVYRLKKDFKSEFFILFHHFRETRFINRKSLLPSLFSKFFFSGHLRALFTLTPTLSPQGRGGKDASFLSSSSLVIFLSASNPPKPPFLKGELRGIIIPNSAICNPHSEEVFQFLILFGHLSMLDDVMLKHFAFPFGEHLIFDEHKKAGFLIELQLICELLL